MTLLGFGIHQFINKDLLVLKSPSIIFWGASFILYFVAIVLYKVETLTFVFKVHEAMIITVFGFIVLWVYSHLYKSIDTIVYTVIIAILTLLCALVTIPNPHADMISLMLVVRLILTTVLVAVGVHVVWKQIKAKQMENFPLLYLFAFGYWVTIAYWI